MPAIKHSLIIERGATFTLPLTWRDETDAPINLTGYTAKLQMRRKVTDADAIVSLTELAGITLGGTLGTINAFISAAQTATLPDDVSVWALELTSASGVVTRLIEGTVYVSPRVVR